LLVIIADVVVVDGVVEVQVVVSIEGNESSSCPDLGDAVGDVIGEVDVEVEGVVVVLLVIIVDVVVVDGVVEVQVVVSVEGNGSS
jgi:hypothetical protein